MFNNLKIKIMFEISPAALQNILIAALTYINNHQEYYPNTKIEAKKLYKWVTSIDWDEPNEKVITIDEKPF